MVANNIQAMCGILNGTCNYILSKMTQDGSQFEMLEKGSGAGVAGGAEPSLDVDGYDTLINLPS